MKKKLFALIAMGLCALGLGFFTNNAQAGCHSFIPAPGGGGYVSVQMPDEARIAAAQNKTNATVATTVVKKRIIGANNFGFSKSRLI